MNTVEAERRKYERMWTEVPAYRNDSPGERLVDYFLKHADYEPGDTLIDLGCGTGRAGLALYNRGLDVTLYDISAKAVDADIARLEFPFIEHCVWLDDDTDPADWVYCCDVLEHIPPEHIDKSLAVIRRLALKGAFLQIAMFHDGFGARIGERLHLTVENQDWWLKKLAEYFSGFNIWDSGDQRLIVLTKRG
jgi:SAM-dependent methyltransferase